MDLEYCIDRGIDIIRRMSGGGTIYTDSNCIEYSVVVDQKHPEIPMDLEGSFRVICTGIITALKKLGIDAYYKPVNDVLLTTRPPLSPGPTPYLRYSRRLHSHPLQADRRFADSAYRYYS